MANSAAPPPYRAYATLMGVFTAGVVVTDAAARALGRKPPERNVFDLAVLGLATFKASRTLSHDEVTSFIRDPFVEGVARSGENEQPVRDGGIRQAVGELVTCSRCVGTWVAAGITAIDVLAPRFGRMLSWALAVGGANDWMQAGFAALAAEANRRQEQS